MTQNTNSIATFCTIDSHLNVTEETQIFLCHEKFNTKSRSKLRFIVCAFIANQPQRYHILHESHICMTSSHSKDFQTDSAKIKKPFFFKKGFRLNIDIDALCKDYLFNSTQLNCK